MDFEVRATSATAAASFQNRFDANSYLFTIKAHDYFSISPPAARPWRPR